MRHLPASPLDCPESLGKGGFQEGAETQGEKTRAAVPCSQQRLETPHPSGSLQGLPGEDREGTLRAPGVLCGALTALPAVSFHLKEGDLYPVSLWKRHSQTGANASGQASRAPALRGPMRSPLRTPGRGEAVPGAAS